MTETPPSTPGLAAIQRAEFTAFFARFLWGRAWLAAVFSALALGLSFFDPAPWRRWTVAAVAAVVVLVSWTEIRRFHRRGLQEDWASFNIVIAVLFQVALIAATGGIEGPLLPVMLPVAVVAGLLVDRLAWRVVIVALDVAAVWGLLALALTGAVPDLVPRVFGGGSTVGSPPALLLTSAAVFSLILVVGVTVGRMLRRVFDGAILRAIAAREESLQAHADRARELTALSGEIAHELKNPLATVKGLAGLLAKDLPEGKPAERLAVLRREVDRMGEVLESFLNFSRPLVPLEREPADLGALSREVAILHEGMARERRVELSVFAGAVPSRSDPRKVKQILLNLLQNALDASPAGGSVELEAELVPGGARLRVLDRGPGLAPDFAPRVFEPGVTTKAKGSGLGLTIARALARQHGGELSLGPREGGGLIAEVFLPAGLPEAA